MMEVAMRSIPKISTLAAYCFTALLSASSAHAGQYKKLFEFHLKYGAYPQSAVIDLNGTLYGETPGTEDGSLFSYDLATGAFAQPHIFHGGNYHGIGPVGSLIDFDGILYGVTRRGGPIDEGTIFTLDPVSGAYHVVYKFKDATLKGEGPSAGLLAWRNKMYGTTAQGGAYGDGAIYEFNPLSRSVRVVYSFTGGLDGAGPSAHLVEMNGKLYGALQGGGNGGCMGGFACGTVFEIDPKSKTGRVVYSFTGGNDGFYPNADLIEMNGLLYGTTFYGGSLDCGQYGCGTVFSIDPSTNVEKVLYFFTEQKDGAKPAAGLLRHGNTLYGTTIYGDGLKYGGIFKINPAGGVAKEIYNIPSDWRGDYPAAPLISSDGTFYGTTALGGGGYGTIFSFNR